MNPLTNYRLSKLTRSRQLGLTIPEYDAMKRRHAGGEVFAVLIIAVSLLAVGYTLFNYPG